MDSPYFSIIIPTLNSERLIEKALQSVLSQTFSDFEVLIVDGLSNDKTLEIIRNFDDQRIKIFSERDRGIYDAMNKGIDLSKGNWIYFMGSDDQLYDSSVLEKIAKVPKKSSSLVCYGKAHVVPEDFITTINVSFFELSEFNLCHQAIFYSRGIFREFRYDLKYRILADWDLNLKIFGRFRDRIISVDIIVSRFLNTGRSARWREEPEYLDNFTDRVKLYKKYLPFYMAFPLLLPFWAKRLSQILK